MASRSADVIVIGGGIAGLAAAVDLSRRRLRVVVIEARERLGGRIWTERPRGWPRPAELGAQFVHAGNDAFWTLIETHGVRTKRVPARHWWCDGSRLAEIDATGRIADVTKRIDARRMRGWSFAEFLKRKGANVPAVDRRLAIGFVEGFEAARSDKMSASAVAGETLDDSEQYAFTEGYGRVISALMADLNRCEVAIRLRSPCRRIDWSAGAVRVRTGADDYSAPAVIVTVPLGVLQARLPARGAIAFAPRLRQHERVAADMGVGHVIRVTLRMDGRRWRRLLPQELAAARRGFGFIHAPDATVPVWWSLDPEPIVTGWAGGPKAVALAGWSDAAICGAAIGSMAGVLRVKTALLRDVVLGVALHNWSRDPYSRGAYSYTRVGQDSAAQELRRPVENTIFFAGEATADGEEVGTVHGALASGLRAAAEVAAKLGA